jgi:hypothetical protein
VSGEVPAITSWRDAVGRTPVVWKAAAVIGVAGWFLSLGGSTTTTVNGVTDCDGFDLGPIVVAVVVAILAVIGFRQCRQGHPARQLPARWAWAGLAVLGALAGMHVLRSLLDPAGAMC